MDRRKAMQETGNQARDHRYDDRQEQQRPDRHRFRKQSYHQYAKECAGDHDTFHAHAQDTGTLCEQVGNAADQQRHEDQQNTAANQMYPSIHYLRSPFCSRPM